MQFDPNNKVVNSVPKEWNLKDKVKKMKHFNFLKGAWNTATNDFEKFTSAHFVARHQETTENKLLWDEAALNSALKINDDHIKGALPSLYLNVAKCYENLGDFPNAKTNYENALSHANLIPNDVTET